MWVYKFKNTTVSELLYGVHLYVIGSRKGHMLCSGTLNTDWIREANDRANLFRGRLHAVCILLHRHKTWGPPSCEGESICILEERRAVGGGGVITRRICTCAPSAGQFCMGGLPSSRHTEGNKREGLCVGVDKDVTFILRLYHVTVKKYIFSNNMFILKFLIKEVSVIKKFL